MNPQAAFGLSIVLSLLSSVVAAMLYVWPWLLSKNTEQSLMWLVVPHMFLRFIGIFRWRRGPGGQSPPLRWDHARISGATAD